MGRQELRELLSKTHQEMEEISDAIWEYAEPRFAEQKSSALQQEFMKRQGFEIEAGIGGIGTAFLARFGSGSPVIGFLGEFDALPGLSQKEDCDRRQAKTPGGWGHGCGHHLLGTACMEACTGLKEYMEKNKIPGTIIYFGCPGEEAGAGKAFMVREGCFDACDVCLAWHPASVSSGSVSTLANARVIYSFHGISSHAAVSPHLGRSALDALELMNIGVNFLREHIIPEARVHYAITNAGGDAPNVVQAEAEAVYSVRAPKNSQMKDILDRVSKIAQGAALMTETQVDIRIVSAYADVLQNKTLDQLVYSHMKEVYPLEYTKEEEQDGKRFYEAGVPEDAEQYRTMAAGMNQEKGKEYFKKSYADFVFPPSAMKTGSTDVGDVSWNIPSSWFNGACYALGTPMHTWQAVAQGKSGAAHRGMHAAALVLAETAADLLEDTEIVKQAKADFEEARSGRQYETVIPPQVKAGSF